MSTAKEPARLSEGASLLLDIARALAAQAVLVGHSISYLGIARFLQPPQAPWIQDIGVVFFFLLSGFLVAHSVQAKATSQAYSFRAYFIDRFSRVYSVFFPCLLLVAAIDVAHIWLFPRHYAYRGAFDLRSFVGNLFMLQDWPLFPILSKLGVPLGDLNMTSFGSARPFWTMAVFWWLYMFYGWLRFAAERLSRMGMCAWLFILALLAIVPICDLSAKGASFTIVWFFGVGAHYFWSRGSLRPISSRALGVSSMIVFALAGGYVYFVSKDAYNLTFSGLLAVALLLALAWLTPQDRVESEGRWTRGAHAAVRPFAKYSFVLFLLHYSLIELLMPPTSGWLPWARLLTFVGVSNAAAALVSLRTGAIQRTTRDLMQTIRCGRNGTSSFRSS